ncbi:SMI1/KNR4 family protein [Streptomyces sp. NPDC052301]|uniref:SMI1/KNR4 family protein n=1 Tax=Streptomyces sp. NPDC052301 TaxID=3365687 RepID=UPI0037D567DD
MRSDFTPVPEIEQTWARVTDWLNAHAPRTAATLYRPAPPQVIDEAQERMGTALPPELWTLLTLSGLDTPGDEYGLDGFYVNGHDYLGIHVIERWHAWRWAIQEDNPDLDPAYPFWRKEWIPIAAATSDYFFGHFLDGRTGEIGRWGHASSTDEGVYPSLAAFLGETADHMEAVSSGHADGCGAVRDGRLVWN